MKAIDAATIDELVALHHSAQAARETLSEGIENTAEVTGLPKSAIRRYVRAVATDSVDKLDAEQQAIEALMAKPE